MRVVIWEEPMTDEKYTMEEIRAAIGRAAVQTDDFTSSPAQLIVAELTRPKHKFRAGEITVERWPNSHLEKLIRINEATNLEYCRPLRLSEMPKAVEDLRRFVDWVAAQKNILPSQRASKKAIIREAVKDLAKFDAEIER